MTTGGWVRAGRGGASPGAGEGTLLPRAASPYSASEGVGPWVSEADKAKVNQIQRIVLSKDPFV